MDIVCGYVRPADESGKMKMVQTVNHPPWKNVVFVGDYNSEKRFFDSNSKCASTDLIEGGVTFPKF